MLSNLIPRIDVRKWDIRIVNLRDDSKAYDLWDKSGVKYFRMKTPGKFLLGSVLSLAKVLKRERVNIVEIYGLRANIIGRLAAKLAGVPVILTGILSTDDWRRWNHVLVDRLTSWAVDGWVANSEACKRSQINREKHPEERITVIYDGIDVDSWIHQGEDIRNEMRQKWGYNKQNLIFVTIANLRPDKGVQYLVEAIPAVVERIPEARFVLVGSDWMGGKLQARCKELSINDKVLFTGFCSDIHRIYHAADVVVLPSLREGLPICLIEAMSMELPVVASAVSGVPELVIERQTGLLVPSKDVKALTETLLCIGQDGKMRIEMGQAGRKRVREKFTIERMANELTGYYEKKFENWKTRNLHEQL